MRVAELVDALAGVTGDSAGRFIMLARRLQYAGILPKSAGGASPTSVNAGHAVALLLAHLSGAEYDDVAAAVARLACYRHVDENGEAQALEYIGLLLSALVDVDKDPTATGVAFRSSITVAGGDHPAVVVRIGTAEDPLELAFTEDAKPWKPFAGEEIARSTTMPGRLLFRLARAIEPLLPPSNTIARRVFPFHLHSVDGHPIDEWREGVEGELAKMPVAS